MASTTIKARMKAEAEARIARQIVKICDLTGAEPVKPETSPVRDRGYAEILHLNALADTLEAILVALQSKSVPDKEEPKAPRGKARK